MLYTFYCYLGKGLFICNQIARDWDIFNKNCLKITFKWMKSKLSENQSQNVKSKFTLYLLGKKRIQPNFVVEVLHPSIWCRLYSWHISILRYKFFVNGITLSVKYLGSLFAQCMHSLVFAYKSMNRNVELICYFTFLLLQQDFMWYRSCSFYIKTSGMVAGLYKRH